MYYALTVVLTMSPLSTVKPRLRDNSGRTKLVGKVAQDHIHEPSVHVGQAAAATDRRRVSATTIAAASAYISDLLGSLLAGNLILSAYA